MPLDGVTLSSIFKEMSVLVGGRVDKITQPEPDEVFIGIRVKGENHKLILTANSNAPRVHFTEQNKTSPLNAPLFTMVLRKHLGGGRIVSIGQPEFERIVELSVEAYDEMRDKSVKRLIIEIMGKHSNILLVDSNQKILEAIKHVPLSVSAIRPILPGLTYTRPPSRNKVNPLEVLESRTSFFENISNKNEKIQQAIFKTYSGISSIFASEICLRAKIDPDAYAAELSQTQMNDLYGEFYDAMLQIDKGAFSFRTYWDEKGKAVDMAAFYLLVYSHLSQKGFESASTMLEAFYTHRDNSYRLSQKTTDMRKLINNHQERCRKKAFLFQKTEAEIKDRDDLRIKGELLTAYLYMITPGSDTFAAENYYENNKLTEIPLDPVLSPSENAQAYFAKYNKQKRTYVALMDQVQKNNEEMRYLDSVAQAMELAADESDIRDIRAELAEEGFAKRKALKNKKAEKPSKPINYTSSDGFQMFVGKNNTQNDFLTMRRAGPGDIWLHTKDIPGSHVIIMAEGKDVPESTILEAANLAAYYSKARLSSSVPVDYVTRKHVKKPAGAKPGFVIYDNHKTVYVTPVEPSANF